MRQDLELHADSAHSAAFAKKAAIRRARLSPTSRFDIAGQSSTPLPSTRWMVLRSPPKTPLAGETSLARIQSQPFLLRLTCALATTFSVSAAKPITSFGRRLPAFDKLARM